MNPLSGKYVTNLKEISMIDDSTDEVKGIKHEDCVIIVNEYGTGQHLVIITLSRNLVNPKVQPNLRNINSIHLERWQG